MAIHIKKVAIRFLYRLQSRSSVYWFKTLFTNFRQQFYLDCLLVYFWQMKACPTLSGSHPYWNGFYLPLFFLESGSLGLLKTTFYFSFYPQVPRTDILKDPDWGRGEIVKTFVEFYVVSIKLKGHHGDRKTYIFVCVQLTFIFKISLVPLFLKQSILKRREILKNWGTFRAR